MKGKKMNLLKLSLIIIGLLLPTTLMANPFWVHDEKTTDSNGDTYCQIISSNGLGFRFYSNDSYLVALLDFDVSFISALQEIIKDGEGRVILQPDKKYAYFTTMKHEAATLKDVGDMGVQRYLSRLSIVSGDYHLIEAIKDSKSLNIIVTNNAGRIINLSLDDVNLTIPLGEVSEAIDWALKCVDQT